jgi:hypothetical protein
MRSTSGNGSLVQSRSAWEAPVIVELPIGSVTRFAGAANRLSADSGAEANPPPPATPSTKLGFSFEMSFPLSVRTE